MSKRYENSYGTMCNIYNPCVLLSSHASHSLIFLCLLAPLLFQVTFTSLSSFHRQIFRSVDLATRKEIRWMDGLDGRMGFPEMDSKEDCLLGKGGRFAQRIDYRHSILPGPIRGFWVQKRRKAWSWEKREEVCGRTMPKFDKKC